MNFFYELLVLRILKLIQKLLNCYRVHTQFLYSQVCRSCLRCHCSQIVLIFIFEKLRSPDATLIGRVSNIFRAMFRFGAKFIFVINFKTSKAGKYFSNKEYTTDISLQSSTLFISDDSPSIKMVCKSLQ